MRLLDAAATQEHVSGLVHLDTQRASHGLDLTVDGIARVEGAGRLDFGGSEFEPAERKVLAPELAAPDDDYGWWELAPGSYVLRYNEALDLAAGQLAVVRPLPRLLQAGAAHPGFVVDGEGDPIETLLSVGDAGCALKENARVSRVLVMDAS